MGAASDTCDDPRCVHHTYRDRDISTWSDRLQWEFALASHVGTLAAWGVVMQRVEIMREYVSAHPGEFENPEMVSLIMHDVDFMEAIVVSTVRDLKPEAKTEEIKPAAPPADPYFDFRSEAKALLELLVELGQRLASTGWKRVSGRG